MCFLPDVIAAAAVSESESDWLLLTEIYCTCSRIARYDPQTKGAFTTATQ